MTQDTEKIIVSDTITRVSNALSNLELNARFFDDPAPSKRFINTVRQAIRRLENESGSGKKKFI